MQRGHDNTRSNTLGSIAFAMDIVDTSVTASFAALYTLEQLGTAAAGPEGAATGFIVGETAYLAAAPFLTYADAIALGAIFFSDLSAGRTGMNFQSRQAYVGVDTLMSIVTMQTSSLTYAMPVAPGVYLALGGDVIQLAYDFERAAGFPGYSLQVQW